MGDIVSGVNVITEFEVPHSSNYSGYIDYMNKEQGKQQEYRVYNDYLAKTDSLFTKDNDNLNEIDILELKELFETAQKNGSLLWKTVISFDNRWLDQYGIYNMKKDVLNEAKMREVIRKGVNRMLANEGLQHALWSAGIHYDTDNIHVHVATVEIIPMRKRKNYKKYEIERNEKNKLVHKKPVVDKNGEHITTNEYVGMFKASSIKLCRSIITNEIMQQKDINIEINSIIRDQIVKAKKNVLFRVDPMLRLKFFQVYEMLPECPKNMWNYGQSIMQPVRPYLDELSDLYIKVYHQEDAKRLNGLLKIQSAKYMIAYGNSRNEYYTGKIKELHKRLGNAILEEMRIFGEEIKEDQQEVLNIPEIKEVIEEPVLEIEQEENEILEVEQEKLYSSWTRAYKEARKTFYGSEIQEADPEKGIVLYEKEAEKGNILAVFDLAEIYKKEKNQKSEEYYRKAKEGWEKIYQRRNLKESQRGTIAYKLAKCYDRGYGVERDVESAKKYYQIAEDRQNIYAAYSLGNIYYYNKENRNENEAYIHYKKGVSRENKKNPFCDYQYATLVKKRSGTSKDLELSNQYYEKAFNEFLVMEKEINNPKLEYRIGNMYYYGIGTEKNSDMAILYLERAEQRGYEMAKYMRGKIYLSGKEADRQRGVKLISELAEEGNSLAQYTLGKAYYKGDGVKKDLEKAAEWFQLAAEQENQYAQYYLAKSYFNGEGVKQNYNEAAKWYSKVADQGNEYAQYQLGNMYLKGLGVKQDVYKALNEFKKSADQNNQYAQYIIGKIYMEGWGVEKNIKEAVHWMEKAGNQGNEYAQYFLGKIYMNGEDIDQDFEKAVHWFNKSAEKGNQYAQYRLGIIHLNGLGVKQDTVKAIEELKKSANQNNRHAQYMLGKIYMEGIGVEQNLKEAASWYEKAGNQDHSYAQYYLGKMYLLSGDMKSAGVWLSRSIKNGNILSANLYMHEIEKLGNGQKIGNISKIKQQINQSMNEFLNSMHKDYEAWKNIIEHDQMLQNERNMEREDLSNQEI